MNAPEYCKDLEEWQQEQRRAMWQREDERERLATIEAMETDEQWLNRWARDERDL